MQEFDQNEVKRIERRIQNNLNQKIKDIANTSDKKLDRLNYLRSRIEAYKKSDYKSPLIIDDKIAQLESAEAEVYSLLGDVLAEYCEVIKLVNRLN
jgi:hypothetical protein